MARMDERHGVRRGVVASPKRGERGSATAAQCTAAMNRRGKSKQELCEEIKTTKDTARPLEREWLSSNR